MAQLSGRYYKERADPDSDDRGEIVVAVVKHYSIKNSPLALLKYITGETKAQKAEIQRV